MPPKAPFWRNREIAVSKSYPTMIDNVRKLTFWNTGVGMDDRELKQATDLSSSINKHMALDGNYGIGAKVSGAVFLRTSPTLTTLPGLLSRLGAARRGRIPLRFGHGGRERVIARLEDRGALVVVDEAHIRQGDRAVIARR